MGGRGRKGGIGFNEMWLLASVVSRLGRGEELEGRVGVGGRGRGRQGWVWGITLKPKRLLHSGHGISLWFCLLPG